LIKREFKNPQGLNEILSEVLGRSVHGDWDEDMPSEVYIGKIKREKKDQQIRGKTSQKWGKLMEDYAFSYLERKLASSGWRLYQGKLVDGKEYDCIGWTEEHDDKQPSPDIAIEMHFPYPQNEQSYFLQFIKKQTDKMVVKLERLNARHPYILIGVPRNKTIKTVEFPHPKIKLKWQEHRFGQTVEKRVS